MAQRGDSRRPQTRRRALVVSPYHGGSHRHWAEGLERHSRHDVQLLTLPDRFWKWRMHGGAITLARRFLAAPEAPDLILATDMLDLTTFLALTRSVTANVPAVLYMHENQLTYPLPLDGSTGPMRRQGGERDHHYAFVNFSSMLAADHVVFNSEFHRGAWFEALPGFLRHFPEHNELGMVTALETRSAVIPVGIDAAGPRPAPAPSDLPPTVIWNQRWEYDKNPQQLVRALADVAGRDVDFRVAICGQAFGDTPPAFDGLEAIFGERLVHLGFAEPHEYQRLLNEALITVSTAEHEFFGVAVLEAMAAGTFALLPDRLSYPEILGNEAVSENTRRRALYRSHEELVEGLARCLAAPDETRLLGAELARNAARFDWARVAGEYDALIETCGRLDSCDP